MISTGYFRRLTSIALTVGLTTLAVTSAAFADVKLVQTMTIKSNAPQATGGKGNTTVNTTAYYKGNKIRQETPQQIILMDGDTKQAYTLNKAQRTYMVTPLGAVPNTPGADMMRFDTKTTITPTGRTRTIAGKVAKGYTYTSVITMGMNAKGQQMMKAQGAPKNAASLFPTFRITGETWATEAIQVPPIAAQAALSTLRGMPGMRDFAAKITSIKGLPLEYSTNMTMKGGMMAAAGAGPQGIQVNTKTVTTQISQAPLPASLFTVPAGYKKMTMPAPGAGRMRAPAGR